MRDGPAFASGVEVRPQSPIVGVGKGGGMMTMMPMAGARWVGGLGGRAKMIGSSL
jgi:hypothetical protein